MGKKKKRNNRNRLIIFLLIIAALIFAGIRLTEFLKPILGHRSISLKKINTIEYKRRKAKDKKVNIKSFNEHIIKFEEKKLSMYNEDGDKLWEKELSIDDAIIGGNRNYIVAINASNGKLYYIDYRGEIKAENSIDKEVEDISINDSGYVLAMLEKEIYVFDPEGEIISNFIIPKGEIIDGDLSNDNSSIALTILAPEDKKFYSNILFYSLEGKVLAGKKYDNDIVYKIFLINNNNLLALGKNRIEMITDDDQILWQKDLEENLNIGLLTERELLVLNLINKKNTIIDTKNRNLISQLDLQGNILSSTPIAKEVLGLDVIEDSIAAFTNRTIYILDRKGNIILEKKINKDIKSISWVSRKNLLVTYKDKLEIMSIN